MLARLDESPWQSLHHAYGTAEDVPGLLRGLAQPDQREEALFELFGNIWHQGTVYEASSYAVPFLFELAAEPLITRRDEILGLIGALADGKSYLDVHAQPGLRSGEFWRQKSDFEERLAKEKEDVRRTREAVLQQRELVCRLLGDATPMVRGGAAHVLSRFPEQVNDFGPLLRRAISDETNSLARSALLWCLGSIGDDSPDAVAILDTATQKYADPREAFAAAIALYRIKGEPHPAALPIYRQMAAARWFAEAFLAGVSWDFSAEVHPETLLAGVEPDPIGATQTLLVMLTKPDTHPDAFVSIVHDLIELNFDRGEWRQCTRLTSTQEKVLHNLVKIDAAWQDPKRLWFMIPEGGRRISEIKSADIQAARDTMRTILRRADLSP